MIAVTQMEYNGVPIDTPLLGQLMGSCETIQDQLIATINPEYDYVYEGRHFREGRFEQYLSRKGLRWPRLSSGRLDLEDKTFKEMARAFPVSGPLRELRVTLSQLRLNRLTIGAGARNRTLLWPFDSLTGRNQPSNAAYIFGPSTWIRSIIQPPPGYGLAYIDWEQQEFAIAAALSGDGNMLAAYQSGDSYLAFAKQARAIPEDATKQSHPAEREQFKQCILATQYGMGSRSLAIRIGQPEFTARGLLQRHKEVYRGFWQWADNRLDRAILDGQIATVFGWRFLVRAGGARKKNRKDDDCLRRYEDYNPRSLRNFPMQAHGAEMLRLACCFGAERGIEICAPNAHSHGRSV